MTPFYPQGWQARQVADVGSLLDSEPENFWLALRDRRLAGFVGLRLHPDDRMAEIHIIAVSPECQRQGVGRALLDFAERRLRQAGMAMVMVETVGDSGHEPARRAYEASGYQPGPSPAISSPSEGGGGPFPVALAPNDEADVGSCADPAASPRGVGAVFP